MEDVRLIFTSATTGIIVGCFCTPFDVIKNFWQFNPTFASRRTRVNSYHIILHIYKNNGIRAFWTGLYPAFGVLVPSNIVFFYFYERLRVKDPAYLAGVKARMASVCLIAPMEYVRTRLQANMGNGSVYKLIKTVIQEEGVLSLWRGVFPTLIRDVPYSALFWELNTLGRSMAQRLDSKYNNRSNVITNFVYPFTIGGISAGLASLVTHPFDVIKTNMQAANRIERKRGFVFVKREAAFQIINRIYRTEGLAGFLVGIVPRVFKLIPSSAVLLGTYHLSQSLVFNGTG